MTTPTWRERTAAARTRGRYLHSEKVLVRGWPTCAIGEQHALHPDVVVLSNNIHIPAHQPMDPILRDLGNMDHGFAHAVEANDIELADHLLDLIEDRVLALKRGA